jgi:hypothetical protein
MKRRFTYIPLSSKQRAERARPTCKSPSPELEKTPAPALSRFGYRERSPEVWQRHAEQTADLLELFRYDPELRRRYLEIEGREPPLYVDSLCFDCGHRRDAHCITIPRAHLVGDSRFTCLFEHCQSRYYTLNTHEFRDCLCTAFRRNFDDVPQRKMPKVDRWTACANCGHWKAHHCSKHLALRPMEPDLSLWAQDWGFFESTEERAEAREYCRRNIFCADGQPYVCKHFGPVSQVQSGMPVERVSNPEEFFCSSTACASWDETQGDWCGCQKFESPFTKKKMVTRKPRRKAGTLIPDSQMSLFTPPDEAHP